MTLIVEIILGKHCKLINWKPRTAENFTKYKKENPEENYLETLDSSYKSNDATFNSDTSTLDQSHHQTEFE